MDMLFILYKTILHAYDIEIIITILTQLDKYITCLKLKIFLI